MRPKVRQVVVLASSTRRLRAASREAVKRAEGRDGPPGAYGQAYMLLCGRHVWRQTRRSCGFQRSLPLGSVAPRKSVKSKQNGFTHELCDCGGSRRRRPLL
jgi:hypothetical protein